MDKEKVLAQLSREWCVLPPREDELTARDIMNALKSVGSLNSKEYVYRKLKDLCDQEILQKRQALRSGGGKITAYSPAEGKSWEDVLQYIKVN